MGEDDRTRYEMKVESARKQRVEFVRLSDLEVSDTVQRIILPFHSGSWKGFLMWIFFCGLNARKGIKGEGMTEKRRTERKRERWETCSCSHPAVRNERNVWGVEAGSKQELNSSLLYLRRVHLFYFCPSH